LLVTGI
jgi:hypothetical protein